MAATRFPASPYPELVLLANVCQTIGGLRHAEAVPAALVRLEDVASTIDSTDLPPLPRQLCRQIIIDTFLQFSEGGSSADRAWPGRVRSALIAERPLTAAVSELVSEMPAVAPRQTHHPLTTRLLAEIHDRHTAHGLQEGQVAKALNVSANTVGRVLRQETGTNFRSLLREVRIRHATELLREGDLSLKQIAWAVGYRHASQFSRDFVRSRRCSPSDYRRAWLHRGVHRLSDAPARTSRPLDVRQSAMDPPRAGTGRLRRAR